jgi:hypothetical protein
MVFSLKEKVLIALMIACHKKIAIFVIKKENA